MKRDIGWAIVSLFCLGLWVWGYSGQVDRYNKKCDQLRPKIIALQLEATDRTYLLQKIDAAKPGFAPWENGGDMDAIEREADLMVARLRTK